MGEDNRKNTKLHRSLQLYLSKKLKKIPPPINILSSNIASSRRLLSTCRFPRTPSSDGDDHAGGDQAATLSDVDRFLSDNNLRPLYVHGRENNARRSSSPGTSASLVDETQPAAETWPSPEPVTRDGREASPGDESGSNNSAIVIPSMDPYADLRRSMQNVMRMHHGQESQPLDWDFLEELLFYYLQLNDRGVRKYVLKAFADLTAGTHDEGTIPGYVT